MSNVTRSPRRYKSGQSVTFKRWGLREATCQYPLLSLSGMRRLLSRLTWPDVIPEPRAQIRAEIASNCQQPCPCAGARGSRAQSSQCRHIRAITRGRGRGGAVPRATWGHQMSGPLRQSTSCHHSILCFWLWQELKVPQCGPDKYP